jgi:hypothetical protein
MLIAVFALSSCASANGGTAGGIPQPSANNGITIGPSSVAPGTHEYESPWPFGPLGMSYGP